MVGVSRTLEWLEKWSGTVFLVAGGLSLIGILLSVVGTIMNLSMQAPSSLAVFTGVVLSFVALFGLYPRLVEEAAQLARTGLLLVMFPLIFTFILLAWHSPELVGIHVPSLLVYLPSPALVYGASFVLTAIGITIFGVVSLRTRVFEPIIGWLLLALAAVWIFLIGAAAVYGFPIPDWIADAQGGLMGIVLVAIGYRLKIESPRPEHTEPTPDTTAR